MSGILESVHPYFAAFPVAILSLLCISEIFGIRRSRPDTEKFCLILLWCAAAGILITFGSGFLSLELAELRLGEATQDTSFQDILSKHHNAAWSTLFLALPLVGLRLMLAARSNSSVWLRVLYMVFLIAAVGATLRSGYWGGSLAEVNIEIEVKRNLRDIL